MTAPLTVMDRPSDKEVRFTRLLDAPRDLVWQAWTDPARIHQWWGPTGFTTTTTAFELRVGGEWIHVMHGPDGTDYPNRVVFREIVPPSLLVYEHGWDLPGAPLDFKSVVTFKAEGEKTRLTLQMAFYDAEAFRVAVERYGAIEGGVQHVDRLAEYLAKGGAMKSFTLTRQLAVPPRVVWEAWTDARAFRQWMGPVGWDITDCTIDLRPGGRWTTTQRSPDGGLHPTGGSYLVVDPPKHLAFDWVLTGPDGSVVMEAEHHVRLAPKGAGTELSLEIRILIAGPGSEGFVAGVKAGWTGTLGKLATFVGG